MARALGAPLPLPQELSHPRPDSYPDPIMNRYVTHLESALDGTRLAGRRVHTVHQGRPLWVRYDLAAVRAAVTPADLVGRPPSLWRYRELLPLPFDEEPVTLGEGMTPLLPCPRLGSELGLSRLFVKDESQLPTGSFKSRGMTAAVSMAKHFGLKRLAIPTAGNAGGALAAYGARAGMEVFVFMPEDTPIINQIEAHLAGASVFLVNGLITDCGRIVREGTDQHGLVRHVHAQGAVPPGRQEDDGPGAGRAARLAAARRDPLPDRRRHRPDRHVEGVRGIARAGLAEGPTSCRG